MSKQFPVIIMAGGKTPEKIIAAGETEPERAFLDVCGRPMLAWVLDAIRGCSGCGKILVIGNDERLKEVFGLKEDEVKPQGESMLDNFLMGMNHFIDSDKVLVVTCDIPLITSEILSDLIVSIEKIQAQVHYPIINVKDFDEKFSGSHRTVQQLKEGTFTGGNIFMLEPVPILRNRKNVEAVIRDRKRPDKLIKLFGLGFIIKFLTKQLDKKGLEEKASKILGATMRAVITKHPEVGLDVDKPDDLTLVRKILAEKNPASVKVAST